MRILVYPHELTIGGSQINAIDVGAAAMRAGHEVMIYGSDGELVPYVRSLGLRFIEAKRHKYRPSPDRILQLLQVVRREKIDLVHAYEWPPCLDAYFGATLIGGVPLLCTVLSMSVMPAVPRGVPLIMGTRKLAIEAAATHRAKVWPIELPIDVQNDHPCIGGAAFRSKCGVGPTEILLVTVSRLAVELKLDALVRAIDAVEVLGSRYPIKLALVGDGAASDALQTRGDRVNRTLGRQAVLFCGATTDPRTAYAGADIVLGMGSSALRAMAIGRPVIVQGEEAFSAICEPSSLDMFLHQGFYGLSDSEQGPARLVAQIESLIIDPERRERLGTFGRRFVSYHCDLEKISKQIIDIYEVASKQAPSRSLFDAMRSALLALKIQLELKHPGLQTRARERHQLCLETARSGAWPPLG